MGIKELFHFGRARDKPKDYYTGTDYRFLFGPTTSGKNVDEFTAMQTTAVYSCVRILSEAIASLPLMQKEMIVVPSTMNTACGNSMSQLETEKNLPAAA